jgi:hypothetical protein
MFSPGAFSKVLATYAVEIRDQPAARLYFERERQFLKCRIASSPENWEDGAACLSAFDAVDPLAGLSENDILIRLYQTIEEANIVSLAFNPHTLLHIMESGRLINLRPPLRKLQFYSTSLDDFRKEFCEDRQAAIVENGGHGREWLQSRGPATFPRSKRTTRSR